MEDNKIAYLQLIQEPISRMSTASAVFKGFAATIVAGVSAISYCEINILILGLSFLPVILFALLDIYYLMIEKKYRYLYEQVRTDRHEVDFSLNLTKDNEVSGARVRDCIKSPSIYLFYPLMILILIAVFGLKCTKLI